MSRIPNYYVNSVFDIDLEFLKNEGINNILLDLDNTILPRDRDEIPEEIQAWVLNLKAQGFKICLVSNNWQSRILEVAGHLGLEIVTKAVKPLPPAFLLGLRRLGARPRNTVMIGDQLFTDVAGAAFLGMMTIMVMPLTEKDLKHTLFLRNFERVLMRGRKPESM